MATGLVNGRVELLSTFIYLIKVTVFVCVFSIGGHTVGPTVLKFGTEDHIYPRRLYFIPVSQLPGSGEAKEWFWRSMESKGCISEKIWGFAAGVEIAPGEAGYPC